MKYNKFPWIMIALAILIIRYLQQRKKLLLREISRVVYKKNSEKNKDQLIHQIVSHCPSLQNPKYTPLTLFSGTWPNMLLYMAKQKLYTGLFYRTSLFRKKIHFQNDGGKTAYVWLARDTLMPPTAPIVFILHTLSGQLDSMHRLMDYCFRRGWRPCALIRRGHLEERLSHPCFNIIGDPDDTHSLVKAALREYPETKFVGMIGLSAGSGLLVNYLGKFGSNTLVSAACCVCPAYNLEVAFKDLGTKYPIIDSYLLRTVNSYFLQPNSKLLRENYPETYNKCSQASCLNDFFMSHTKFAGCADWSDYLLHHNPANFFSNIQVPMLVINSDDDIVCTRDNIREDWFMQNALGVLLRTPRGAHLAYNDSVLGFTNYVFRVSLDFLDSSQHIINGRGSK